MLLLFKLSAYNSLSFLLLFCFSFSNVEEKKKNWFIFFFRGKSNSSSSPVSAEEENNFHFLSPQTSKNQMENRSHD